MSRKKDQPQDPVKLQFVRDEDVDFCENLWSKNPLSKPKKSLVVKKNDADETSSKKITNSERTIQSSSKKPRSSTRLSKAPFSERSHFRRTEGTVTDETNQNEFDPQTPKRPCRVSKTASTSDDFEVTQNPSTSELNAFNTQPPKRTSKRLLWLVETSKSSKLRTKSTKAKGYPLRSKSNSEKPSIKYRDDSTAESSPEIEGSDNIPSSTKIQNEPKKSRANTISTPSKNVQKSNSKNAGLSTRKSQQRADVKLLQTPAAVRKRIKNHFAAVSKQVESDDESSDDELEQSADEFRPSSSETESSESEEESDGSNSETVPIGGRKSNLNSNVLGKKKNVDVELPYKVDADDYFLSKCSKEPTSNNQLSSLEVSHLEEDEINHLLRNEYTKHGNNADSLIHKYKNEFTKWLFYLKENFNLLMYGLGSKIELLEYFHTEMLAMHDVLTIHGYFPRLLVKDILNSLIVDILKISAPKNASEALPVIKSKLQSRTSPVFVIIHNVDRLISRQRKHQSIISKLASFPNLHMIVSIDHINAPLLWGNSMLTELNLVWMNVTTYQPYVNETSFENLIYLNEAGTDFVSLSSLRNIFKPLASRVKKIFQIIAKERLENANNRQYKGMSYENWYHKAKEELLVNNITVFKVQLTELIDHGIIKTNDHQCIPILVKVDILDKFYKEMYGNEEE